jgi:uncharacterized iron-regulated membrane protein
MTGTPDTMDRLMHQQATRQLQERRTTLSVDQALESATRFFARGGVYTAFIEKRGPTHVVLRGQGGEEIVIAARPVDGVVAVTGSSYLFDQQIARFLDSLPPAADIEAGVVEQLSAASPDTPAP